jgi:hypothetical protein
MRAAIARGHFGDKKQKRKSKARVSLGFRRRARGEGRRRGGVRERCDGAEGGASTRVPAGSRRETRARERGTPCGPRRPPRERRLARVSVV